MPISEPWRVGTGWGAIGEKLVAGPEFYAIFASDREWKLMAGASQLGTIPVSNAITKGNLVVFAGRRWLVENVDETTKVLRVSAHRGGRIPKFERLRAEEVHDRLVTEMRAVYEADDAPAYFDQTARELLAESRETYRSLQLKTVRYIQDDQDVHLFLWRGTAATSILAIALAMAGPERYLDLVRRGSEAVAIPVIASLNGSSKAGWIEYAKLVEQAGAAALELNMYHIPTGLPESGLDVETRYIEIVEAVCRTIALPVSVKLTAYLSSIGHFAATLVENGADGVVLFNRLLEPDIDLDGLSLTNILELSEPAEMRLPLLRIAILAGRIPASLAASTGVATANDVVKCLLAGAGVVMTTSALLRHDIAYMAKLVEGLRTWMDEREIASLADMRGILSWQRSRDRGVYMRANYLRILERYAM
jgi:dihydroorotate dehydrogenase (fumarate)